MLDALQTLLTRTTGPVFVDDEEDRLVLVVVDVIGRETIGDDELCDWIDRFGSWLADQTGSFDPPARAAAVNLKRFVRTLHLALSLARPPPRPAVRQARDRRPRHRPPLRRRADLSRLARSEDSLARRRLAAAPACGVRPPLDLTIRLAAERRPSRRRASEAVRTS